MKLLIDGDVLVYKASTSAQHSHDWGDGIWTLVASEDEATVYIENAVGRLLETYPGSEIIMALSDKHNFRRQLVDSSYKANRSTDKRPMLYQFLRDHLKETYDVRMYPTLEGDDVLGILATTYPDSVIVSIDKDFKTVPCRFYNMDKDEEITLSPDEARYHHLYQTLVGDTVDGYPGCPGIGPKTAEKLLTPPYEKVELTKRGSKEVWAKVPCETDWEVVVSYFEKAGMTEEDALRQARLARILQKGDYDIKKKEVKLWAFS